MVKIEHEENRPKGRFVINKNDEFIGELTYAWSGDDFFIIDHTFVEEKHRNEGHAEKLVLAAVEFAREQEVKILPLCPYVKRVFEMKDAIADVRKK